MNENNKKVFDYLVSFCDKPTSPEYAVLLKGKWGCGKTWFVNELITKLNSNNIKTLKVSLYGFNTTQDIDEEFFKLLHPILASKQLALAGKVLKTVIKAATISIPTASGDVEVESNIFDLSSSDFLSKFENAILIFDDIERCSIPLNDLLGYFNHLVEFGGAKVILVANESELTAKADYQDYLRTKEKLIGKTFEIEPEIREAISSFVINTSAIYLNTFKQHQLLIEKVIGGSEYKNLRFIKQALTDFEWILDAIPANDLKNDALLEALLTTFLVFSIEVKSGTLKAEEIKGLHDEWATLFTANSNENDTNIVSLINRKYPSFSFENIIISLELWTEFFQKGMIDNSLLKLAITQSYFFYDQNTESWKQLWYARRLQDDEIRNLMSDVVSKFQNFEYKDVFVFLHVFGILLFLLDIGIYRKTAMRHVKESKRYIDKLKTEGILENHILLLKGHSHFEDAYGLGYYCNDRQEFEDVKKHLIAQITKSIQTGYPKKAQNLLHLMKTNMASFLVELGDFQYDNVPILSYLSVSDFADAFVALTNRDKSKFLNSLKVRYHYSNSDLDREKVWFQKLSKRFTILSKRHKKTMLGFMLEKAGESIIEYTN